MKNNNLLFVSVICFLIAFLAWSQIGFDYPDARIWGGPTLQGEWLLDETTGEFWYFHAEAEDEANSCRHCHDGFDTRPMWWCNGGWFTIVEF